MMKIDVWIATALSDQ